jgi:hypothetical protein
MNGVYMHAGTIISVQEKDVELRKEWKGIEKTQATF